MSATPIAENPLEVLVSHLIDGTLGTSPEGIAIVGWLCDFRATDPAIEEIIAVEPGILLARHTGETGAEPLGLSEGFFQELRLVCANCGLTGTQIEKVLDTARRKISVP